MKKITVLLLNLYMFTLVACSGNMESSNNTMNDFVENTESVEVEATMSEIKVVDIDFLSCEVQFVEIEENATPYTLSMISEQKNNVSEVLDWFGENNLSLPMLDSTWESYVQPNENIINLGMKFEYQTAFYDENYIYEWTTNFLNIYEC